MSKLQAEQLSKYTWKIVEDDPYGQYPFFYAVLCADKCVVIDTGCGTQDCRQFIDTNINKEGKPYTVICTHCHFDHIGGNHFFGDSPIYMGAGNQTFTNNWELNSLAAARNAVVNPFKVTRWLKEGDRIYYDENNKSDDMSLEVLFTPGHTPDGISLYAAFDKRIFVGDILYPFAVVHVDCLGSDCRQFKYALTRLASFLDEKQKQLQQDSKPEEEGRKDNDKEKEGKKDTPKTDTQQPQTAVPQPQDTLTADQKEAIDQFCGTLDLTPSTIRHQFDIEALMTVADWQVASAVETYFSCMDNVGELFPPKPQQQTTAPTSVIVSGGESQTGSANAIMLSCGHVEGNLASSNVSSMVNLIECVAMNVVEPINIDDGYAEYTNNQFSIMLPLNAKWDG